MVEIERQAFVRFDVGAENLGDHFLVGRPVKQFALVPVGDAQHLRAVGIVAAAFAPEVGELQCRHQHFQGAGAVLFLANDLLDLLQHPQTQRQPGIDARRLLPDHARAQHQPMRHDLGLFRILFKDGQKEPRQSHGYTQRIGERLEASSETGLAAKTQGQDQEKPLTPRITYCFADDIEDALGRERAANRWVL